VEGINDEKDFHDLMDAMHVLKMTEAEITSILRSVACVMHIGNIECVG
jgi:myosin heavy subunit